MKKLLLLLALIPINVYASYSDYKIMEKETDNYYEESDLLKREEVRLFNNYYLIKAEDYFELNKNSIKYQTLDKNDYKENMLYSASLKNGYEGPNTYYKILSINKTRYLVIRSFDAVNSVFKSIKVYYDNNLLDYNIKSTYDFESHLVEEDLIEIDLNDYYDVGKLKIVIDIEDFTNKRIAFIVNIYKTVRYGNYEYYSNDYKSNGQKQKYTIEFIDSDDFMDLLKEKIYWVKSKDYSYARELFYYYKKEIKYKYYSLKKEYLNLYTLEPIQHYEHDLNDFIIKYNYYSREKIEDFIPESEKVEAQLIEEDVTPKIEKVEKISEVIEEKQEEPIIEEKVEPVKEPIVITTKKIKTTKKKVVTSTKKNNDYDLAMNVDVIDSKPMINEKEKNNWLFFVTICGGLVFLLLFILKKFF